jgi:outer membrane immunogenic protein
MPEAGRPGVAPIAAAPAYAPETWTGFYAGFEGGGGWDKASFSSTGANILGIVLLPLSFPGNSGSGGVWGGFFGYNWQYGPIVGGLEVNIDSTDIRSSTGVFTPLFTPPVQVASQQFKTEVLASIRGRLGYLVLPNLLLFGTGGIGFDHARLSNTPIAFAPNFPPIGDTAGVNEIGWVAGAGAEYRLWEHLLLRVEYLHYDFGTTSTTIQPSVFSVGGVGILPVPTNLNVDHRVDVVLGGIAYKF